MWMPEARATRAASIAEVFSGLISSQCTMTHAVMAPSGQTVAGSRDTAADKAVPRHNDRTIWNWANSLRNQSGFESTQGHVFQVYKTCFTPPESYILFSLGSTSVHRCSPGSLGRSWRRGSLYKVYKDRSIRWLLPSSRLCFCTVVLGDKWPQSRRLSPPSPVAPDTEVIDAWRKSPDVKPLSGSSFTGCVGHSSPGILFTEVNSMRSYWCRF